MDDGTHAPRVQTREAVPCQTRPAERRRDACHAPELRLHLVSVAARGYAAPDRSSWSRARAGPRDNDARDTRYRRLRDRTGTNQAPRARRGHVDTIRALGLVAGDWSSRRRLRAGPHVPRRSPRRPVRMARRDPNQHDCVHGRGGIGLSRVPARWRRRDPVARTRRPADARRVAQGRRGHPGASHFRRHERLAASSACRHRPRCAGSGGTLDDGHGDHRDGRLHGVPLSSAPGRAPSDRTRSHLGAPGPQRRRRRLHGPLRRWPPSRALRGAIPPAHDAWRVHRRSPGRNVGHTER